MVLDWLAALSLLIFYLAMASAWFTGRLRRFNDRKQHGYLLAVMLLVPFVLATLSAASLEPARFLSDVGRMAAYVSIPALACLFRPQKARSLHALDILAILALWFPVEFGWLPDVQVRLTESVDLPLAMLTAVPLGLLCFLVLRPLSKVGYTFRLNRQDRRNIVLALTVYTLLGIPLGLMTGFLVLGLAPVEPLRWLVSWVLGYLFTALPEELLFRGVIQNQLHDRIPNEGAALLAAAIIFGLAHLNNATSGFPEPNWMYALMATLAGLAYGWTWRRTGKITASAVVHATVNFVWGILLSGGA